MAQIGACEGAAGVAGAVRINRVWIVGKGGILEV